MKVNNQKILIYIAVITIALFPIVAFTTEALRVIIGLLFLIFFPGYTLLSALFPKQSDLGGIERLALSIGLSIAIVPLIGLILNYTPWGIRLYPILISITTFIIITSAIGWYRQRKLAEADQLSITFKFSLPKWSSTSKLDKVLSIALVVAIVAALGCLSHVIATPKQGEKFTEFYILNEEGKAEDYPQYLIWCESAEIVIGIVNHEHQQASYRVKITIDGIDNHEINIDTLDHEEKWEQLVYIAPQKEGNEQKIEFWLYKNGEDKPYFEDPLHLYTDVTAFYVLDTEGKTIKSTRWVKRGNPIELNIGIVNKEEEPSTYRVEIKTNDILQKTIDIKTLTYLELWQEKINFYPQMYGELELWLYKNDEVEPYSEEPLSFRMILY